MQRKTKVNVGAGRDTPLQCQAIYHVFGKMTDTQLLSCIGQLRATRCDQVHTSSPRDERVPSDYLCHP